MISLSRWRITSLSHLRWKTDQIPSAKKRKKGEGEGRGGEEEEEGGREEAREKRGALLLGCSFLLASSLRMKTDRRIDGRMDKVCKGVVGPKAIRSSFDNDKLM